MNAHDIVTTEIAVRLLAPGGTSVPFVADLSFDPLDPYAVRIGFRAHADSVVEWTFARQLLAEGLVASVGEGDVQVWPSVTDDQAVVSLALSSHTERAVFELPLRDVTEFISQTHDVVPRGTESAFVDIDAELGLLLWSEGPA